MIKNLIYGTVAASGVALAAAVALPLMTTSSKTPTSCKVTLDANGGEFKPGTSTVQRVEVAYSNAISQAFNQVVVTNVNHDFIGWTATKDGSDFITNTTPVVGNMECYAKWQRSAIQQFNVTNGVFEGEIVQFPAVFYCVATAVDKTNQIIRFKSPTNEGFRISFDPPAGGTRVGATIKIIQKGSAIISTNLSFSSSLNSNKVVFDFEKGADCVIEISANLGELYYLQYVFGIGLDDCQVRFDLNEGEYSYGTIDTRYVNPGVNLTMNYPFGYLPTVSAKYSQVTFQGWYSAPKDGVELTTSTLAGTNNVYYAHWKLPSFPYTVEFNSGSEQTEGIMDAQSFKSDVYQVLSYNRFYWEGHKFVGWATSLESSKGGDWKYYDGESVCNLCEKPYGVCTLFATWRETPGTNNYTVSQYVKEFKHVALATNVVTFVNGTGSYPTFTLSVTNSADLRVSLDPNTGCNREGAELTIYKQFADSSWSNVCTVTDLATSNTTCFFEANTTYRFNVTGASTSYAYAVGLGAKGYQIDYDSCGVQDMSFNWTVDTPYGYWPTLTSSKYGTYLGWFYNKDITDTNEVSKTESVVSNATIYAHWANQPYYIRFDGRDATSPSSYVQDFYYNRSQALDRNQFYKDQSRFLGWATNSIMTNVVYSDGQVVSNLCTIAGGTNTLYAVWDPTPGTNWYYVAGVMTNFQNISFAQGQPTLFVGTGDMTQFMVTTTNVSKCRVALDPQEGFSRTGAKLTIDCAEIPTNKTEELEWENACTVTDLTEKKVTCSFTTNCYYRFTVSGLASTTNGYVVSIGAEGARYIFDVCGGNFVGEKETTKLKFYNWTVGAPIAYTPPVTTNAYVHGSNTWHYTPQYWTAEEKIFNLTNLVVSGGEKLYAHWSDAVIVDLIFNWNLTATNVVFTNYYGQGATVKLYDDDYVRQPTYDGLGFLGWTTNKTGTAGYDLTSFVVTTNSTKNYYAQWTDEWKTSRTSDGSGLSIDGYYGTLADPLDIPKRVNTIGGVEWPVNVVAIGDSAFTNCLFASLSLPNTLTSIGSSAFMGCSAFATLKIWNGVTYVGDSAFEDCTSLTTVTFEEAEMPDEYATEGFLDGIFDGGTPTVELGTCLFKGCTSLKDVDLPLGVNCIPDECFSGCTAMTSFADTPYTVIEIGTEAFYGCTHLTNVVFTEIVNTIGSGAFKKCARLKFVSFIGDQPDSVESDIFEKTPRNVFVRYLANMCTTAKDYCGGSWPELPGTWPSGDDAKTLTWLGGKYPRRKVIFNYNNADTLWESTQVPALYHGERVFGLLAPTEDEMNGGTTTSAADDDSDDDEGEEEEAEEKTGFSGWYTQPMGGRKIGSYWEVPTASEGDSAPITVYAHWGEDEGEGAEAGSRSYGVYYGKDENTEGFETWTGFYSAENEEEGIEGDDMFYYSACTFNGIVIDLDNDNAITGTVEFVFQDGTYPADGGVQSAFTATVTWNGGKKTKISGVADAEGYLVASGSKWSLGKEGEDRRTVITKSGINGWLSNEDSEFRIYAARNRTAQATDEGAARTVVLTGLQATKGTWHVVLKSTLEEELAEGAGEFANGYSTLSITIANMGQATITGTLGDGTSVSTSSTLIIGDGCCCLPVSIRPYNGKGGFSFLLWFTWQSDGSLDTDDASIQGLTAWDASMSKHPFTATLTTDIGVDDGLSLTFIDEKLYSGPAEFEADVSGTLSISGKVWKVTSDTSENKLRLNYDDKTGIFTGSYVTEEGNATVKGVFTDRIKVEGVGSEAEVTENYHGFGTAVIKDVGSVQVEIRTE